VLQAVEKLPHKQQAALMLRNYQGFSYEEIGETLDCSPEAARANVYQAIKKLRP
jgi:RNA polymerase sigma-70 factor (ECF subfamily)